MSSNSWNELKVIAHATAAAVRAVNRSTDALPVVKSIFGAIDCVITTIRLFRSNRDDWTSVARLLMQLHDGLRDVIGDDWGISRSSSRLTGDLERLLKTLQEIQMEIEDMQRRPSVIKFFQTYEDPKKISGFRQAISDASTSFVVVHVAAIERTVDHLVQRTIGPQPLPGRPGHVFISKLCPLPTTVFTGRTEILAKLVQFYDPALQTHRQRVFALTGLGGIGKSQIVYRFVELAQADNSSIKFYRVFYVDATTMGTLTADLKSIAQENKVGDTAEAAVQWLSRNQRRWLLIFNNADDVKMNLRSNFPHNSRGNILITSRNEETQLLSSGGHCKVPRMNENEALELLSGCLSITSDKERQSARKLAKVLSLFGHVDDTQFWQTLGHFPLLLVQAAACIATAGYGIGRYLSLLQSQPISLPEAYGEMTHRYDDYPSTAYSAWMVCFKQLSPEAATLLQLSSFLHHDNIDMCIFPQANKSILEELPTFSIPEKPSPSLCLLQEFLASFRGENGEWDPEKFMRTIRQTRQYSFLDVNTTDDSYSIHPLVHEWIRSTTRSNPNVAVAVAAQYLCGFAIAYYDASEQGYRSRRRMFPHVSAAVTEFQVGVDLSDRIPRVYLEVGLYRQAEAIRTRVLKARQGALGMEHRDTVGTMSGLAAALGCLGRFEEATAMYQEALDRCSGSGGDRLNLSILCNLGLALADLGKYEEAETKQQQALERLCCVPGRKHPDTIWAMVTLARTRYMLGRRENAEELLRSALSLGRDELGSTHPTTIKTMSLLSEVCDSLQKTVEAAELRAEVERIESSWNS